MIGLGVVALGAAIAGRDSWRYGILTTLVGAGCVLVGTFMNRSYLKDLVTMRGVSRRRSGEAQATPAPGAPDADRDKGPRRVR